MFSFRLFQSLFYFLAEVEPQVSSLTSKFSLKISGF